MAAKSKGVEEEQERRAELSHLTKHCLLQAAVVLSQNATAGPELTKTLCTEVADAIKGKGKAPAFSGPLVSALDTSKFLEGAITPEEYALLLAEKLEAVLPAGFNVEPLHGLCYRYYSRERRSDITYPKWLTADCTYRLWLVFNCTLDQSLVLLLPAEDFNEIIQKIVELCGFSWAEAYRYTSAVELDFPMFLEAVTNCFERLSVDTLLTCEVIADLHDQFINGVLRKGYLVKKGHLHKNYKRRWFVLQRTVLMYYVTRDLSKLKGQLVLNSKTEVLSLPDRGAKKCRFLVTCGHTGKPFEILADDQRSKQQWMLAIKKAITLAKFEDHASQSREDITKSLKGFYQLKYGVATPTLRREDSDIRHLKYLSGPRAYKTIAETSTSSVAVTDRSESTSTVSSEDGQEEYMSMNPIADGSYLSGGRGGEEEEESGDEYVPPIEFLAGDVTQDVTDDKSTVSDWVTTPPGSKVTARNPPDGEETLLSEHTPPGGSGGGDKPPPVLPRSQQSLNNNYVSAKDVQDAVVVSRSLSSSHLSPPSPSSPFSPSSPPSPSSPSDDGLYLPIVREGGDAPPPIPSRHIRHLSHPQTENCEKQSNQVPGNGSFTGHSRMKESHSGHFRSMERLDEAPPPPPPRRT